MNKNQTFIRAIDRRTNRSVISIDVSNESEEWILKEYNRIKSQVEDDLYKCIILRDKRSIRFKIDEYLETILAPGN